MSSDSNLPPVRRNGRLVISFDEPDAAPPQFAAPGPIAPAAPSLWATPHQSVPPQPPVTPARSEPVPVAVPWQSTTAPRPASRTAGESLWWQRAGAMLVDTVLGFAVVVALSSVLGLMAAGTSSGDEAAGAGILAGLIGYLVLLLAWGLLYAPLTMGRAGERNGQTLGKQLVGIRVVRLDGQPMTAGSAALREVLVKGVLSVVGALLFYIPIIINYLWPIWDDRGQALHDKPVGTAVISA